MITNDTSTKRPFCNYFFRLFSRTEIKRSPKLRRLKTSYLKGPVEKSVHNLGRFFLFIQLTQFKPLFHQGLEPNYSVGHL